MQNKNLKDTDEFHAPVSKERRAQSISSLVEVDLAGLSDKGVVRDNNEDTFFIARFDRSMTVLQSNLSTADYAGMSAETGYGMLVADGMGGHAAGELASRTAALVLLDQVLKTPDWIMRLDDRMLVELMNRTEQRLKAIQGSLVEQARINAGLSGMGTTLTLAWSLGADLIVAHVGDSRAYLMRDGKLQQLTRDQTFAQEMVEAGVITVDAAAQHRLRHVLTGVLTTAGKKITFQFRHFRLLDGDQVLLCSDGLTEMVSESTIADILRRSDSAADACRSLVNAALEAGGKDNITVTLACYRLPQPDKPS